jgi:hypothetical protein
VKRYTPDCVYDDQFVYANDRYKMAGQWFALPKLFKDSKNEGYEIIKNDRDLIQFKNEQSWTFKLIPKTATINALVSLSLDPGTVDSDFIQVKYHKDQANDKDYSREYGLLTTFRSSNTVQMRGLASVSRSGRPIMSRRTWIVRRSRSSRPTKMLGRRLWLATAVAPVMLPRRTFDRLRCAADLSIYGKVLSTVAVCKHVRSLNVRVHSSSLGP